MSFLTELVLNKVRSLPSTEAAADFFGFTEATVCGWMKGESIPVSAAEKVFSPEAIANLSRVQETKQVCILLPWYKTVSPVTAFSIMSILDRTRMGVMLDFGDAFIAHSRNRLARNFLKTSHEWALTIDDDMLIPCSNAKWFNDFSGFNLPERFAGFNTVERLLSHKKTLIGALYFGRWRQGKPVYAEGTVVNSAEEKWVRRAPYDQIKPTKWVGTGCLLVHRSVFLDIEKEFPHLARTTSGDGGNWFTSSEHDLARAATESLEILSDPASSELARIREVSKKLTEARALSRRNSSLGVGEDVQFCIRATQAGHQPYVDLGLVCGHIGSFVYGPKKVGWEI